MALSWEGVVALGLECLVPAPQEVLADVEPASGLGDGELLLGNHLDRSELELGSVGGS